MSTLGCMEPPLGVSYYTQASGDARGYGGGTGGIVSVLTLTLTLTGLRAVMRGGTGAERAESYPC